MRICVNDGIVVFATHLVKATITDEMLQVEKTPLHRLQIEPEGFLCFSDKEREQAEKILSELKIPFQTEKLTFAKEHRDKTDGLKYASRSEAIKHINGEIEMPEHEIIPFLRREKKLLKSRLDLVEADRELLKSRLDKVESEKESMKQRLDAMDVKLERKVEK